MFLEFDIFMHDFQGMRDLYNYPFLLNILITFRHNYSDVIWASIKSLNLICYLDRLGDNLICYLD